MARALTVGMTILAIALSVALFLGVEQVRSGAKNSFANTISGTDLIVGARSGSVQLLLYSVFRIGNATNNITWESYEDVAARPEVEWIVPISLGDSHQQFRVMGTTQGFFDHFKYRRDRSLEMAAGHRFDDLFNAVIGANVAQMLDYTVGDPIVVSHGFASFIDHEDQPFRISGVLAKTGTPVDRTVIVSMEAIEAIHVDWQSGVPIPGQTTPEAQIRALDLTPKAITAALIGVESPIRTFTLQRAINEYAQEPLLAILPGVALQELWGIVGVAETALLAVSKLVVVTALIGMMAMLLSTLGERRREMAVFRAVGAGPMMIVGLMVLEAALITTIATIAGIGLLFAGLAIAQPIVDQQFGLWLPMNALSWYEIRMAVLVVTAGAISSLLPAAMAYRMSVADGLIAKT
nr:ABC transporter permease [Ruegeria sp. HKCCA5929]